MTSENPVIRNFYFKVLTVLFCCVAVISNVAAQIPGVSAKLKHLKTFQMPANTHRPEILVTDSGEIILIVVEPSFAPGKKIKHRMYRYRPDWTLAGGPFVISEVTEEYGEPADHRALLIGSEVVVVYQTLKWRDGAPRGGGPAEVHAEEQSLILARFALSGEKLFERPIVAHVTDFNADNFPDHGLAWNGNSLLIGTGSMDNKTFQIRAVDPQNAKILGARRIAVTPTGVASSLGNSLAFQNGQLTVFSAGSPMGRAAIIKTVLSADGTIVSNQEFYDAAVERNFPVANVVHGQKQFLTFIGRVRGGLLDLMSNPYRPYLAVFGADGAMSAWSPPAGIGFAHVHPTVAVAGDKILLAWSERIAGHGGMAQPRVRVEEFGLE